MNAELFEQLRADRAAHRPVVLLTALPTGAQWLVHPAQEAPAGVSAGLFEAPPLRLILVGAVHIAQPLATMAALTGFAPIVVDPRQAFSTDARFPGVERSTEWPDKAVTALAPDSRTAVVTLTHDPKLDDPALVAALRSKAFYIGCLGSGKTHASRLQRLKELGFTDAELGRLHGPVGLRIHARSAGEVAVSILAQIIQVLRPEKAPKSGTSPKS